MGDFPLKGEGIWRFVRIKVLILFVMNNPENKRSLASG